MKNIIFQVMIMTQMKKKKVFQTFAQLKGLF